MMDAIPWRRRGRRCSSSRWRLPFSFLTLVPCLPTVPISRSLRALIGDTQARASSLSLSRGETTPARNPPCFEEDPCRNEEQLDFLPLRFPLLERRKRTRIVEERNEKCWREEKRREGKEKKGEVSEFSEGDDRNGDSTPHPLCENRKIDRSMRFFAFPLSLSSAFSTTYSALFHDQSSPSVPWTTGKIDCQPRRSLENGR